MRGEKSKCSLEFHVILSVTIENICKQITPAAKFAIRARQWQISANFLMSQPLKPHAHYSVFPYGSFSKLA